jgi:hypothetical protein
MLADLRKELHISPANSRFFGRSARRGENFGELEEGLAVAATPGLTTPIRPLVCQLMRALPLRLLAVLALVGTVEGCGKSAPSFSPNAAGPAPARQGVVSVVTKNTTRLGGVDPATDAAAVARAVYPGLTAATRPQAVVLVNQRNWPASIAAAALASAPLGAPLLYADGNQLPEVTVQALKAMRPVGAAALGGAQVIRIGTSAAVPGGYSTQTITAGSDPAVTAAAVERLLLAAAGGSPRQVIVLSASAARAMQMPAAGLSAESGAPILFIDASAVPAATAAVLKGLRRPAIYLVGAPGVDRRTQARLARLGRVSRVAGAAGAEPTAAVETGNDPVGNAISVSRFGDGPFGWAIHEAGHGLVFANSSRPLDAPAAAPLSAHGDYGPLLVLASSASVPAALARYLSDIEPGYTRAVRPVREVYNHGWVIGDERAISALAQAELDAILEIAPRTSASNEQTLPPPE